MRLIAKTHHLTHFYTLYKDQLAALLLHLNLITEKDLVETRNEHSKRSIKFVHRTTFDELVFPSIREASKFLNITTSTFFYHLKKGCWKGVYRLYSLKKPSEEERERKERERERGKSEERRGRGEGRDDGKEEMMGRER